MTERRNLKIDQELFALLEFQQRQGDNALDIDVYQQASTESLKKGKSSSQKRKKNNQQTSAH